MPTAAAEIRCESGAESVVVRLPVIAEADWEHDARLHEIPLPRIWPMERTYVPLKSRHTLVDEREIGVRNSETRVSVSEGHAVDSAGRARGTQGDRTSCEALEWPDEEIWNLEPRCDIPRWHFLNLDKGCPVHGLAIYSHNAYYPWIVDERNRPYHVKCPVGGEWYPTNNLAEGDHTSGAFPDDGWGWHSPDGAVFGFTAYALLRRIRLVYGTVQSLAQHFKGTGDQKAARKIVYLLISIAREHRYLAFFPEHRFRKYEEVVEEPHYREHKDRISWGPRETKTVANLAGGSGMDDYCINMPYHYEHLSRAYDMVFDRIDGDSELIAFVRARMPSLSDGEKIRRYIETFLFRVGVQAALDDALMSNLPRPQMAMLDLIRLLDQPECKGLVDWLISGGGQVARMPTNFYYKDGASYESLGGYNGIHVSALIPIVSGMRALRNEHPALYSSPAYDPIAGHGRFWHVLRFPFECVVAQTGYPLIGDSGDIPNTKACRTVVCMDVGDPLAVYDEAVRLFPDDTTFSTMCELLRRQAAGETIEPDARLMQPSRLLDGYGLGILESGDLENRRGVWLYYGDHPGHSHEQPMDMGLFAHRRNILRHMGYPYSWQHMDTWDGNWITHFGVKVTASEPPAWKNSIRFLSGSGPFQVVEASGYGLGNRETGEWEPLPECVQRRTLCLVDLPDGRYYAVDLFHVEGGDDHWWTFHGLPGEFTMSAELPAQEGGTVAGKDVAYGQTPPEGVPKSLAYLYDVFRGQIDEPWSAYWLLDQAEGLQLRVTQLATGSRELIKARGRSPHAPAENPPYELDWLLSHNRRSGTDVLRSDFVSLIETGTALPIEDARLICSGPVNGVRVGFDGGAHYILRSEDSSSPAAVDDEISFQGAAGFVEVDASGVSRMTLIGDGVLTCGDRGITRGAGRWRGSIAAVCPAENAITVQVSESTLSPREGDYLYVRRRTGGKIDSFAYRITNVLEANGRLVRVWLNWSPVIGDGVVKEHMETGFRIQGQMPISAARAYYRGAYLVNHDRTLCARLKSIRGGWSTQEPLAHLERVDSSTSRAFPPGSAFTVEEIGVGDAVEVLGWVQCERQPDTTWRVESNGPAVTRF